MTTITASTTTIRSQFDTLIADLSTTRHPALAIARNARNIAQAAAEGKATEKHLGGLRTLRAQVIALHNRSRLPGFRLGCRRALNLIDRLGTRMAQTFKRTAPAITPTEPVEEQPATLPAPQVNVKPRDLVAEAEACGATAAAVACAFDDEAQARMASLTGGIVF